MFKKDGVSCFFKGVVPNVIRSGVLTMGQLCTNSQIIEFLSSKGYDPNGIETQCLAKGMSGFFASFLSLPFDNMKVKLQS